MEADGILTDLMDRVSLLEKSNRRLTLVTIGLTAAFFAVITMGAASANSESADTVSTRHLKIINDEGSTIMEMLDDDIRGPMMYMYDRDGNLAAELDAHSAGYGAALRLYDSEGIAVMDIGNVRGWGPGFALRDGNGADRVRLNLYGDDPRLTFHAGYSDAPLTRASLGLINNGIPELALYGEDGEILFYQPVENLVE